MTELNELLEHLWELLGDVPTNDDDEIDEDFMCWPKGTHREDIWRVFDNAHEKGVAWLMYGEQRVRLAQSMNVFGYHFDTGHTGVLLANNYFRPDGHHFSFVIGKSQWVVIE